MAVIVYYRQGITGGAATDLDGIDSSILNDKDLCIVANGTTFYLYQLDVDSGAAESSPSIISPDDSAAGDKRWKLQRQPVDAGIPAGSIVPWIGGYFGDGSNGSYTDVLLGGNSVALANAYLNADNWYVCNGAALNTGTGIFNGASRYLPNLTDSRFIMGDTTAGSIGGAASNSHTHSHSHGMNSHTHGLNSHVHSMQSHTHVTPPVALTIAQLPAHSHTVQMINTVTSGTIDSAEYISNKGLGGVYTSSSAGSGATHEHGSTYASNYTNTGAASGNTAAATGNTAVDATAASSNENRPLFLSCFYIMKVA